MSTLSGYFQDASELWRSNICTVNWRVLIHSPRAHFITKTKKGTQKPIDVCFTAIKQSASIKLQPWASYVLSQNHKLDEDLKLAAATKYTNKEALLLKGKRKWV